MGKKAGIFLFFFFLMLLFLMASKVRYVGIDSYSDFISGKKVENLEVSYEGRLYLGRSIVKIADIQNPVLTSAVMDESGNLFIGSVGEGKVFKVDKNGAVSLFYKAVDKNIFALTILKDGELVIGTSPSGSVIFISKNGKSVKSIDLPVKYIWKIVEGEDGSLFVATGMPGKIFKVNGDKYEELFDSHKDHITTMATDRSGGIIFGCSNGGIYRWNASEGNVESLFDTESGEIRDIKLDRDGVIYALCIRKKKQNFSFSAKKKLDLEISEVVKKSEKKEKKNRGSITVAAKGGKVNGRISYLYKIDRNFNVSVIWSSKKEIGFSLLLDEDGVYVGTLSGRIYRVDNFNYTTLICEKRDYQLTQMVKGNEGTYLIFSNPGEVAVLKGNSAKSGEYFSDIIDTEFLSTPGKVFVDKFGKNLKCEYFIRGGNVEEPDETWSMWQKIGDFKKPVRFFQIKLVLTNPSDQVLEDDKNYVESIDFAYLSKNQKPILKGIYLNPPNILFSKPVVMNQSLIIPDFGKYSTLSIPSYILSAIQLPNLNSPRKLFYPGGYSLYWNGEDKDGDFLTYSVYYREEGVSNWKLLVKDTHYEFCNISKGELKDGAYFFKVIATDKNSTEDFPARMDFIISKKVIIDTSGPSIEFSQLQNKLDVVVKDKYSTIFAAEYRLSDEKKWRRVFPLDKISDDRIEKYSIKLGKGFTGKTLIFRAIDYSGNLSVNKFEIK